MEAVSTISWPAMLIGARSERRTCSASMASSRGSDLAEQQQGELVAADAGQRVLRSQVAAEAAGDGQQQAVADHQPERGVHGLELVDVDEQQRRPHQGLERGALGDDRQPVEEQLAIGQAGQAVVHGVVQQPLLRALGVGHLAQQADAAQAAAVGGGHAGRLELEPAVGVVRVPHAELDAHLAAGALLHRRTAAA